MKGLLTRKFIIYIVAAAIVGLITYGFWPKSKSPYSFISVSKGEITQTVSVTGNVTAAHSVNLAFTESGQAVSVGVSVGQDVISGEALASLDPSTIKANLNQAEANLQVEQSDLASLISGATPQEIEVKQAGVQSAQSSLNSSSQTLLSAIQSSYVSANDAVRTKTDEIFTNPTSNNPRLLISISDQQLQINLLNARISIQNVLNSWNNMTLNLSSSSDMEASEQTSINYLNQITDFLTQASEAINQAVPAGSVTSADISAWQSDISAARLEVTGAVTSLSAAESDFSSAEAALNLAEKNLNLTEASATPTDISAAEAKVEQAKASVQLYKDQLVKSTIYSPIDGQVSTVNIKTGEVATANSPVITVISKNNFQIEAYVADSDIAKVAVGDLASTTLDAYGDSVNFQAKVISIDPGETVIEGVPTYKVTFEFMTRPEPVKAGMTANINIVTATKNNALIIPQRAVIYDGGKSYVLLKTASSSTPVQTEITTGITGSDGTVEVVSGLKQGDEVVNYTISGS
ncbi:MAG: efflux RND transporter periplasmic adaptor subunit [Patescibacteria group bacterium]|nr:efflux RND transporter periplasmic adaptor subunit [Patescibacteria group bacterium]